MYVKEIKSEMFSQAHDNLDAAQAMLRTLVVLIGNSDDISEVHPDSLSMTLHEVLTKVRGAITALN